MEGPHKDKETNVAAGLSYPDLDCIVFDAGVHNDCQLVYSFKPGSPKRHLVASKDHMSRLF